VLRKKNHVTALKILLETGRKNQIRVHCKEAGYPILGDTKYGATKEFRGRVALHARKLGFKHERQGRSMVFEQEPPIEFSPYLP
jgi:23S rRNA-/tRNA-specific pseudouridylate synthase